MRVCYITSQAVSAAGWGRYSVEVIKGARALGIEPVLVTPPTDLDPAPARHRTSSDLATRIRAQIQHAAKLAVCPGTTQCPKKLRCSALHRGTLRAAGGPRPTQRHPLRPLGFWNLGHSSAGKPLAAPLLCACLRQSGCDSVDQRLHARWDGALDEPAAQRSAGGWCASRTLSGRN